LIRFENVKAEITKVSETVLPEKIAEELGIEPISEEKVSTGAGEIKVKRDRAWTKLKGKEDAFPVRISDLFYRQSFAWSGCFRILWL